MTIIHRDILTGLWVVYIFCGILCIYIPSRNRSGRTIRDVISDCFHQGLAITFTSREYRQIHNVCERIVFETCIVSTTNMKKCSNTSDSAPDGNKPGKSVWERRRLLWRPFVSEASRTERKIISPISSPDCEGRIIPRLRSHLPVVTVPI